MEKKNKIICIVLAVLLVLFIGYNYYKDNYSYTNVIEPEIKPIKDSKYDFVDNQVMISIKKSATESEIEEFFNKHTEIINKKSLGVNGYLITIDHSFNNRNELLNYCNNLASKNKNVIEYCEANNIIKLDDCSKGPC